MDSSSTNPGEEQVVRGGVKQVEPKEEWWVGGGSLRNSIRTYQR